MYNTEILKKRRKEQGITGIEMAKRLNISAAFYSQIENKKKKLYYDNAIKIADILGTKPDSLFYPIIK